MSKRPRPGKYEVFLNYKLWLSAVTGEGIIEEHTYRLLRQIKEMGSLKAASDETGISYRKAWGDLKKAEELLGYVLTEKTRGGKSGGHSTLTPKAIKLLEAYEILHSQFDEAVEKAYGEFKAKISDKK